MLLRSHSAAAGIAMVAMLAPLQCLRHSRNNARRNLIAVHRQLRAVSD
jgi:hypothetical protein